MRQLSNAIDDQSTEKITDHFPNQATYESANPGDRQSTTNGQTRKKSLNEKCKHTNAQTFDNTKKSCAKEFLSRHLPMLKLINAKGEFDCLDNKKCNCITYTIRYKVAEFGFAWRQHLFD